MKNDKKAVDKAAKKAAKESKEASAALKDASKTSKKASAALAKAVKEGKEAVKASAEKAAKTLKYKVGQIIKTSNGRTAQVQKNGQWRFIKSK